jgi:hypothetical protein
MNPTSIHSSDLGAPQSGRVATRPYDAESDIQSGVRISHERPAPETEPHIIAPLIITLADGSRLVARQWSLRGIRDRVLSGRDLAHARLEIPFQGIDVGFPVTLAPAAEGGFWTFEGLNGRQREALGLFYRNLLAGKMAAMADVITALDTPVDLIPMGETAAEKAAGMARSKPRALRAALNVVWYVGLFCLVVGFLGHFVWRQFEGMTLSHARIYADRIELKAPREGYIHFATAGAGVIERASPVAWIVDPEIEAGIADAERQLSVLQTRIEAGRARLALHLAARDSLRGSIERLYSQAGLDRFDAGISLRAGDLNDQRMKLEQELRGYEDDLARTNADLRRLRQTQTSMQITAPIAGHLAERIALDGQYVRGGDTIAVLETDAPRVIRGWLDDRLAGSVRPGMSAEIRLAGGGRDEPMKGEVVRVEAGSSPDAPDVYGLVVTVAASEISAAATWARFDFNRPVEVVVKRGLAARWFHGGP